MIIRLGFIRMLVCFAVGVIGAGQTVPKPKIETTPRKSSPPVKRPPDERKPTTATLTGKVFAITKGGDLKPARMASLFVLSGDAAAQFKSKLLSEKSKAAEADSRLAANPTTDALFKEDPRLLQLILHERCLRVNTNTLQEALDLAERNDESSVILETDEQGSFRVAGLKPGTHTVIAIGRAGANDCVWIHDVTLEAGHETPIKMHTPSMACPDI